MSQAAKNNVAELNSDVAKQMSILREDIATLTSTVAENAKAQGSMMKSAATERAVELADSGKSAAHALKSKAEKSYSDAEEAVRANPGAAIGVAAGIGFLVGMLSSRR